MRQRLFLLPLALVALPLLAQDRSMSGGFQLGALKPLGSSDLNGSGHPTVSSKDIVDGKIGFFVGGHFTWNFSGGGAFRLRLDSSALTGTFSPELAAAAGFPFDAKVNTIGLMGDYVHHFSGKSEGFYLTVGLGYERTRVELDFNGITDSESKNALALAAGFGMQVNPLIGVECRYVTSRPDFDNFKIKNDRVTLGLSFSF